MQRQQFISYKQEAQKVLFTRDSIFILIHMGLFELYIQIVLPTEIIM